MVEPERIAELLERHRDALERLLRRRGAGLLRFESVSDLVQGVQAQALEVADRLEYRGDEAFLGWIAQLARQHVADRHAYWSARKRDAGRVLRITSAPSTEAGGVEPDARRTGPATFAERRDLLVLATQAVSLLAARDQELVRAWGEGEPVADVAARLGLSYDAAERARLRAVDRFRKTFELLSRGGGGARE